MKFDEAVRIAEEIILEKREYKHRPDYKGNEKGSYIEKGKTYWDYSEGATPGNERLVSQIQNKITQKFDSYASRSEIKKYLKSKDSQKLFDKLKKTADKRFGGNENDSTWRAYVYGGFSSSAARILSKGKKKGISDLL